VRALAVPDRGQVHGRFTYKAHMRTHAQGTDPRVAEGAQGEAHRNKKNTP